MINIQYNLKNKIKEMGYSELEFCYNYGLNKESFYGFSWKEMTSNEEKMYINELEKLTHGVITYNYIYYTKTVEDEIQEDKGFTIICNNCGSCDVEFQNDIGYDYDENPYICGHNLVCKNCGQVEDI